MSKTLFFLELTKKRHINWYILSLQMIHVTNSLEDLNLTEVLTRKDLTAR